jgi:hypothetical protein
MLSPGGITPITGPDDPSANTGMNYILPLILTVLYLTIWFEGALVPTYAVD